MGSDFRSIVPWLWRRDRLLDRVTNPGHALKEIGYLLLFPAELFLIIQVLVLTASAGGEEGATGLPATGAVANNFHKVCVGTARFVFPDSSSYSLAWETKRHEYHPVSFAFLAGRAREQHSSDTGAEVGQGVDLQLHNFVIAEGFRPEFPWGFYALSHSPIHFGLSERDWAPRMVQHQYTLR